MRLESRFYNELKGITPQIRWTRIENTSLLGTPDLLGYNAFGHFFTVELKVCKRNSVRLSPHQISFHVTHPKNSFILVETLDPRSGNRFQMFRGSRIMELAACGLKLDACCLGLEACRLELEA